MEDPFALPSWVRRIGRWLLLAALFPLWLLDVALGLRSGNVLPVATGPAVVALALVARQRSLSWRAGIAGGGSWLVTLATAVPPGAGWSVSVLESAVLLWMVVPTVRKVTPAPSAVVLGGLLCSAVIAMPLRIAAEGLAASYMFSFISTFPVAGAVGLGSYLRVLDARRARALEAVRHNERLELARDLHDFVAHHVTGIVVQAQAARTVGATSPEEIEPLLRNIEVAGTEALASMRRLVQVLRENSGRRTRPEEGFAELAALAEKFSRTGPHVWLQVSDQARALRLAPEVSTSLNRVVQEALTNVVRHAPGTLSVAIRVWAEPGSLMVSVINEPPPPGGGGRHTPAGGPGGFGLVGLRERVEAVGGELRAGPLPFGGWEVAARLPVRSTAGSAP